MANFDEAIKLILKHEGGLVNDPADPGGLTNMGITKRDFPQLDIKNLTVNQAKEIYKEKYWDKIQGDLIKDQDVATQIFDFAVNAGVATSSKKTQEILHIKADGVIGEQTIKALNNFNYYTFLIQFKLKRIEYYISISKRASLRKFLYGWIKRTLETSQEGYLPIPGRSLDNVSTMKPIPSKYVK